MNEWTVLFDDENALSALAASLEQGPIIDGAGRRLLTEQRVGEIDGLTIEIFSDEHPPPHFRVLCQGDSARFTIKDCTPLDDGLRKFRRNIRSWHAGHQALLIDKWNSSRPTDCPVGVYRADA